MVGLAVVDDTVVDETVVDDVVGGGVSAVVGGSVGITCLMAGDSSGWNIGGKGVVEETEL